MKRSRNLFEELKELRLKKYKELEDRRKQKEEVILKMEKQVKEELGDIELDYDEIFEIIADDIMTNVDPVYHNEKRYEIRREGKYVRETFAKSATWQRFVDGSEKEFDIEYKRVFKYILVTNALNDFVDNWSRHNPDMRMEYSIDHSYIVIKWQFEKK